MKVSRRIVLKGIGGVALALPLLESFRPRKAQAADPVTPPFVIFLRQACGVAAAGNTGEIGAEPERFWPKDYGALTADNVSGRALDELTDHLGSLLVVKNVNMQNFNYGDGHARGALQGLTARGPTVENAAGSSEAAGESIDHRIGAELNPEGRDSLFLYAGANSGWLGGACISYRGAAQRRSALHDPWSVYQQLIGGSAGLSPEARQRLVGRQQSVNDLVREQLSTVMTHPALSGSDKTRLKLHLDAVRDLELTLTCKLNENDELKLQGDAPGFASNDGFQVVKTVKLHMDLAALAVACGYTRSVAIQVGNGNDGSIRYPDHETGQLMSNNFHYISHRRESHDANGTVIPGSDYLHHKVDRQFGKMFKHLLDRLSAFDSAEGQKMLFHGLAVWYNDNGNGPPHSASHIPYVLGGSAGGQFKQGQYLAAADSSNTKNHAKMLNTIGAAMGLKNSGGGPLDDFGDPSLPKGRLTELLV